MSELPLTGAGRADAVPTGESPTEVDPPGPRRLRADDRRRAILGAARRVFAQRGFQGAGTAEIAAAAGCSEPMLYKHFPSKLALFAAVLDENRAFISARLREAADQGDDPIGVLTRRKRNVLDDGDFAERIRLRTLAIGMAHEPAIRDALEATATEVHDAVAEQIRVGQARGRLRDDVDADHASWIWLGIGLVVGLRQSIEGDDALREMAAVLDAFHLLLRRGSDETPGRTPS